MDHKNSDRSQSPSSLQKSTDSRRRAQSADAIREKGSTDVSKPGNQATVYAINLMEQHLENLMTQWRDVKAQSLVPLELEIVQHYRVKEELSIPSNEKVVVRPGPRISSVPPALSKLASYHYLFECMVIARRTLLYESRLLGFLKNNRRSRRIEKMCQEMKDKLDQLQKTTDLITWAWNQNGWSLQRRVFSTVKATDLVAKCLFEIVVILKDPSKEWFVITKYANVFQSKFTKLMAMSPKFCNRAVWLDRAIEPMFAFPEIEGVGEIEIWDTDGVKTPPGILKNK